MRKGSTNISLASLVLLTAVVQGCATTESSSVEAPLGKSNFLADSSNRIVMSSETDCVRTIGWSADHTVVECNSTSKATKAEKVVSLVAYNGRALFEFDSAILTSVGKQELIKLTDKLNGQNTIKQIEIVGHADSIGDTSYNLALSEQRAESVKRYLQQSLSTVSVSSKGMGEGAPVANNSTEDGRRLNRRVEVNIAASVVQ